MGWFMIKGCVRYFLWNAYFSPSDSPLKTTKNVFYFISKALVALEIFKFVYFRLPLFFALSFIALQADPRKILKFMMSSDGLNKNLITHFIWYLAKEIRCDIESLSIDRVSNKKHFYIKKMISPKYRKMCTKS